MKLLTICATVLLSMPAVAQSVYLFDAPICDPCTVSSADKVWSVRMEPGDLYGQGETRYAFSRDGAATWSGSLPVFLTESFVTKDGTLAGWGWTGNPEEYREGVLHVVIVANDGRVLLDEGTPRKAPQMFCMSTEKIDPHVFIVSGQLVLEDHDIAIVRFRDGEAERSGEEWRRYRLSTGRPIDRFRPHGRIGDARPIDVCLTAHHVPSTPLVLSQWSRRGPDEAWGFRWILCDAEANVVWELDLPTDISGIGENGYRTFQEAVKAPHGGILALAERSFTIRMYAESRRVLFEVVRARDGSWGVREIERGELAAPSSATTAIEIPKPEVEESKPIPSLGVIELTADDPPRSAAYEVWDFDIDDQGRFVFSRRAGAKRTDFDIVRVRSDGTRFDVHRLPAREAQGNWTGDTCWIRGDELIAVWNNHPRGHELFVFSLADGSLRGLPESVGYSFHQIERKPDGGFIVLGDDGLMSFDAEYRLLWKRTKSEELCGGKNFAHDARGRIVVLDDKKAIQHVSPEGKIGRYEKLIDLPERLRDDIRADPRSAWWITCASGWVRIDGAGKCGKPIQVERPDGRPLHSSCMRVHADGSMWVSSDGSLFHLTPKLEVDRVLGDFTDELALRKASQVHVDVRGRIHAVCERTGDVFVLDDQGRRLRTIRADPSDFPDGSRYSTHLDVREDGSLIVGDEDGGSVAYDPEGKRLGARSKALEPSLLRQAGTGCTWNTAKGVALIDANGSVVRRVEKSVDGTWLLANGGASTAADGSLAVFIGHGDRSQRDTALAVVDREGELKYVRPLGSDRANNLAWDGKCAAYVADGKLRVVEAATGSLRTLNIATESFEPSQHSPIFLVREGREVWLFDGRTKLHRYAVPRFD